MSQRKFKKQARKQVLNNYELIYQTARLFTKKFKVDRIPLTTMYALIDKGRLKDESNDKDFKPIMDNFNKSLTMLKSAMKQNSDIIGDKAISLGEIKEMIITLKDGFVRGQNEE